MTGDLVRIDWRCMVCGDLRPDEVIAVWSKPGRLGRIYITQHIRYCSDCAACRAAAETLTIPVPGWQALSEAVCRAFPSDADRRDLVSMVPERLHEAVAEYVWFGRRTGDFLRAVFEGDLFEAATRADGYNTPALAEIAKFVRWHFPPMATGSREAVERWIGSGGMSRYLEQQRRG